jgi:hypothetical protein
MMGEVDEKEFSIWNGGGCSLEMMNFGGVKLLSHGGRGERDALCCGRQGKEGTLFTIEAIDRKDKRPVVT